MLASSLHDRVLLTFSNGLLFSSSKRPRPREGSHFDAQVVLTWDLRASQDDQQLHNNPKSATSN